jgi:Protein of unknown function (DUF4242)
MPRYLIEREYGPAVEEDMRRIGARSKQVARKEFPEIRWEHSHVVGDESGIKSFCVYESPDEDRLRRHAEVVGEHAVTHIYEIAGDVTPADFAD